jgi:hypothetical protein
MRFTGFIGPSYTLQSVNVDCQRCVNLYPEVNALGTGKERETASLVPTPGLRLLLTLPVGPCRAAWTTSGGQLFLVNGNKLYLISSTWTFTEMGTLNTSAGPVSMADNGIDLFIVDGTDGYIQPLISGTFSVVSDPNFYPADQVTFQDGYFIFNKKGTTQFFYSGLNATTFDPLDIQSAEASPDNLVGIRSANQNVFLFGSKTVEVFYNAGDSDNVFSRISGAVVDVGCSAPFTIQKIVGSLYWVGGDANGTGIVYRMNGYQPQVISTPAIETVIRSLSEEDLALATAFTYQESGHLFYCLNLPTTNSTWCFDASTNFWHERTYLNLWSLERHRAQNQAVAHGEIVVGDYQNGKIYALDSLKYTDDGVSIARIRAAPHLTKNLKLMRHMAFQLDMETGVGLDGPVGLGNGVNPRASIRWSDDGGHSWSNEHFAEIGKIGQFKTRVKWRRLGMSRDRVYEVKITDPVKVVLIGAELEVEEGLY